MAKRRTVPKEKLKTLLQRTEYGVPGGPKNINGDRIAELISKLEETDYKDWQRFLDERNAVFGPLMHDIRSNGGTSFKPWAKTRS